MPLIDPNRVSVLFEEVCAPDDSGTVVEGGIAPVRLDVEKLETHRAEVAEMLGNLPIGFLPEAEGGGGGWSFLQACMDRDGEQWTGRLMVMNQLFTMGCALKLVTLLLPREMWDILPGGMPYYTVTLHGG
jgi:hypothetical protein